MTAQAKQGFVAITDLTALVYTGQVIPVTDQAGGGAMLQATVAIAHRPGNKYIAVKGRRFTEQINLVFTDELQILGQPLKVGVMQARQNEIMGHSAGGHLALMMASKAERKPWLAIAQSPITDLFGADDAQLSDEGDAIRKWMGCSPYENESLWKNLNPIDLPPKSPVLLIHGERDVDVPIEQSETYARAMKAKGCDVQKVWLPGDHYSIIDAASDDWLVQQEAILDWL